MNNNTARRNNKNSKNSNKNGGGPNIVSYLFRLQMAVKMFHWQTRSYAAHVESGKLFDDIVGKTDEIIEAYMGKYGRPRMATNASVSVPNMTKSAMKDTLRKAIDYIPRAMPPDTYLQNMVDELVASMTKSLYLLTMR